MNKRILRTCAVVAVIVMLAVGFIPQVDAKGGQGKKKVHLTAEELAFADAVGVGEYAYGIDWIYSYEYGEFEMPLGEAWRGTGSDADHEMGMFLRDEMERIGLQDVAMEPFDVHAYHYGGATVQVLSPVESEIWLAAGHAGLPGTPPEGLSAEIVYVGLGTEFDYEGKDVDGKIVMVDVSEWEMYWLQYPHMEAELHGAIGIVCHWIEYHKVKDSVVTHDSECRPTIPTVCISHDNAEYLIDLIETSEEPVMVNMWCDAEIDYDGVAYNVYGYIPGTTNPDEYIVFGGHYDKWWYGASDDGAGVARLLGIAKGLIDSGYEPSRTLIFIATSAEEYGWADTEFDWAIGAWYAVYEQHPEFAGNTLAYFNFEGGGTKSASSVYAQGTPETKSFRKQLLPLFDEYFTTHEPWSEYYYPSVERTNGFATTWADEINFCTAGIPTMNVASWRATEYIGSSYHTQMDNMEWISAESLAMSIISNGIAVIELDRSVLIPYNFKSRGNCLLMTLKEDLIEPTGIEYAPIAEKVNQFIDLADDVYKQIVDAKDTIVDPEVVNDLLLETADKILSEMTWIGGYIEPFYPHQHYMYDTHYIREGVSALESGDIESALIWLSWVYGMYHGRWVSYDTYVYLQLDRWNDPTRDDMFWGTDRAAYFIDIYWEYRSLWDKQAAGITDYTDEIESLMLKYQVQVDNMECALDMMMETIDDAMDLLSQIEAELP